MARRDGLDPGARAAAASRVLAFAERLPVAAGTVVAGYWPMRSEFDPRPLLGALRATGAVIALPSLATGTRLVFRRWSEDEPLVRGRFGTSEPSPDAPEERPSVLVVPLLGFDRRGIRLGYGAGYYDRTLPALVAGGAAAVGLAFAAQEVPEVPAAPHDFPLDAVLTEAGWIDCRRAEGAGT